MTDKFQINGRHQIKSFEKGLITFLLAFVGTIIGGLFGLFDLNNIVFLATTFVLVCIGFSLPAIYLHTTYLLQNWGTIVHVDRGQDSLTIKTKDENLNYEFKDIENSELNLGIYYKNQVDNRGRWPAPWTNYGYLKLKLKDGKEFMFTSLMFDLSKLTLPVTTTKFRLIPSLKR
ncbi:MAG TPA: hypothetical protein VD927_05065 [Chryseosolibacter sp.]|nr:hypothetical protein [Chryseosolibacter sp.]